MYKTTSNQLYSAFFSASNMQNINNMIRESVSSKTGKHTGDQNQSDLYNFMQSVYSVNSFNYNGDVRNQVNWMNSVVAEKAVRQIISGMMMYSQYQSDIQRLPVPSSLPVSTTQYGKKFGTDTNIGW